MSFGTKSSGDKGTSAWANLIEGNLNPANIRNSEGHYWEAIGSNIQVAIADLPAAGGKVQVPAGILTINNDINLVSNLELEAVEGSTTLLAGSAAVTNVFKGDGVSNVVIRGFTIDGGAAVLASYGIWFEGSDHIKIQNNTISNVKDDCISLNSSSDVIVENNVCGGAFEADSWWSSGIEVEDGCNDIIVRSNICVSREMGITLHVHLTATLVTRVIITKNITRLNSKAGIYLEGRPDDGADITNVTIEGNTSLDDFQGIFLDRANECTIENNMVISATADSIWIDHGEDNLVEGNMLISSNDGIDIRNSDSITVNENLIKNSVAYDIHLTDVTNVNIRDNLGYNPVGKIANPFDTTNNLIELGGTAAAPAASTDYIVCNCDIIISSTDSGDTNNAILIKDPGGNQINPSALSTLDAYYVPVGYKINWGAFTGAAPTVVVAFV